MIGSDGEGKGGDTPKERKPNGQEKVNCDGVSMGVPKEKKRKKKEEEKGTEARPLL